MSSEIGAGHFYRQLALAEVAQNSGREVAFASVKLPGRFRRILGERSIDHIPIHATPGSREDAAQLGAQIDEQGVHEVVVDGFGFEPSYFRRLGDAGATVTAVDDVMPGYYPVDLLVNVNIFADEVPYELPASATGLFGPRYALLRSQFRRLRDGLQPFEPAPRTVSRVMVCLGGVDPNNQSAKVLRGISLTGFEDRVDLVAGGANPNLEPLRRLADDMDADVRIQFDVARMAQLMGAQDLAIAGAGTVSWELACLGVPMLQIVLAENQRRNAEGLSKAGCAVNLGWFREVTPDQVASEFAAVASARDRRESMSREARSLVDGKGCERVLRRMGAKAGSDVPT